ncbi:MAG: hypothetical protein Q9168_006115 [Polycauliona sp. 1 TL-2023]
MAPASERTFLINELVSSILSYLPQKDLKSARLVNKTWASLGGQKLIGTIYISPREIDMAAFDGITQNPDLAQSVKRIVYDTAQFRKYATYGTFYDACDGAYYCGAYRHLGSAYLEAERFCTAVGATHHNICEQEYDRNKEINDFDCGINDDSDDYSEHEWGPNMDHISHNGPEEHSDDDSGDGSDHDSDNDSDPGYDHPDFNAHWTDPTFSRNYQQQLLHATETANIFSAVWFDRVVRGLKLLGPITSFALRNTWNDIYEVDGYEHYKHDGTQPPSSRLLSIKHQLTCVCVLEVIAPAEDSDPDETRDRLIENGLILPDGTRLIGSPSARAWPPTGIPPSSPVPKLPYPGRPGKITWSVEIMKTGISDGYWEFIRCLELLSASNVVPKEFSALGDLEILTGVSALVFQLGDSNMSHRFREMAKGFEALILKMVTYSKPSTVNENSDMAILEPWIDEVQQDAKPRAKDKLQALSLSISVISSAVVDMYSDHDELTATRQRYDLAAFIPNIESFTRPNLTTLHLAGFSIDCNDLDRLLCVNLPQLCNLSLQDIILENGTWDDIIEELHQVLRLKTCRFDEPLLNDNGERYREIEEQRDLYEGNRGFMVENERYVLGRGEHPMAPGYVLGEGVEERIQMWKGMRGEGRV